MFSAKAWAQARGSATGPGLRVVPWHTVGEWPGTIVTRSLPRPSGTGRQSVDTVGTVGWGRKGPGGPRDPMAMAERPRPDWASYHNCNTNSCQDLGNSVLLLLGLIICINISINIVTLVRVGPGGRELVGWWGQACWPGPAWDHCVFPHLALEPIPWRLIPSVP